MQNFINNNLYFYNQTIYTELFTELYTELFIDPHVETNISF